MAKSKVKLTEQERVAAMSKQELVLLVAFLFGMLSETYSGQELLEDFDQVMEEEDDEEIVVTK